MAQNPARALADILDRWRVVPQGLTVYGSREMKNGTSDPAAWIAPSEAARLLGEVRQTLLALRAAGRDVDHYERAFGVWAKGVFAPDYQWTQSTNAREVITQAQVDQLRGLADLIDHSGLALRMDPPLTERVTDGLDEVENLLRDPSLQMSQPTRNYLFHLTTSIRDVLAEHRTLGGVDLVSRINELFGVLTLIADELEREEATKDLGGRLRQAARKVVPFAKWVGVGAVGVIDVAANIHQLTT